MQDGINNEKMLGQNLNFEGKEIKLFSEQGNNKTFAKNTSK